MLRYLRNRSEQRDLKKLYAYVSDIVLEQERRARIWDDIRKTSTDTALAERLRDRHLSTALEMRSEAALLRMFMDPLQQPDRLKTRTSK